MFVRNQSQQSSICHSKIGSVQKSENFQTPFSRWPWFQSNEEERQVGEGVTSSPFAIFVEGIWLPSPCTASFQALSVNAFR